MELETLAIWFVKLRDSVNFYFYDLETSGINPRADRIMQFAGQRTDINLKPIGSADNFLIKLPEDVLPQPEAILTHGITPQKTRAEGLSEAEFVKVFAGQIIKPKTIYIGFNNIRFDDEFMRFLLWRNFHDPYEWQWKDSCWRWDLIDVARMTRALRPDGIKWPFTAEGKPTVQLAKLAAINKLEHDSVHDALSDVRASMAVARLLKLKAPKLFDYLLKLRDKQKVATLVQAKQPLVYTSGRYQSEFLKTTVSVMVAGSAASPGALMYDLRVDPEPFINLNAQELAAKWSARGELAPYFPVKKLSYNRCPALAPTSVLDKASQQRLRLDLSSIKQNHLKLAGARDFGKKLRQAEKIMYGPDQPELVVDEYSVDGALYGSFVNGLDKTKMSVVRAADEQTVADLQLDFNDERLRLLLPLYKARNFASVLDDKALADWLRFRHVKLQAGGKNSPAKLFFSRIAEMLKRSSLSSEQKALLKELQSYGRSILV